MPNRVTRLSPETPEERPGPAPRESGRSLPQPGIGGRLAAERENEPFPLSEAQREELDRRLRELDEHPERARPWEEVRKRLWARKRE